MDFSLEQITAVLVDAFGGSVTVSEADTAGIGGSVEASGLTIFWDDADYNYPGWAYRLGRVDVNGITEWIESGAVDSLEEVQQLAIDAAGLNYS